MAESSIVLLDNPAGVLPLQSVERIAVLGPCAEDPRVFFGCYAFPNHVDPAVPELRSVTSASVAESLLGAVQAEFPTAEVGYQPGCGVSGGDLSGVPAAVAEATAADVVVLAVGDRAGLFGKGTSGKVVTRRILTCRATSRSWSMRSWRPGGRRCRWQFRVARTHSGNTGIARRQSFRHSSPARRAPARSPECFLAGSIHPASYRLKCRAMPAASPHTYLAAPLGQNSQGVSNLDPTPAFPFGYGLSYTSFSYEDLHASAVEIDTAGTVELTVAVRNTGARAGAEVVQLYASDPIASVTRPMTQLIGFARVGLAVGESAEVFFTVHSDRLSFTGRTLERIVEPGEVTFRVGTAADTFAGPVCDAAGRADQDYPG